MNNIKTRFAPSPTGYLHIGSLRTALFNFLYAKQNNGKFIIRIEDTDRERYVENAEKQIVNTLEKLGLKSDTKIEQQSNRLKLYQKAADKLLTQEDAYYCFCSPERLDKVRKKQQANKKIPKYDRYCLNLSKEEIQKNLDNNQKFVIRFKIPDNQIIKVEDRVYGNISIATKDLDDFIILKSNKFPTYHLANVVDDYDMRISHVIRGEEWLPSLPKHKLLYEKLNYHLPIFVHLPLLLNADKSKLSKRQGDVAVEDYLQKGYLPEALLNYIAFLGWNPGNDEEMFLLNDLIEKFSLEKINKAGSIFDINKLNWFNAAYIRLIIQQKDKRYQQLVKQTAEYLEENTDNATKALKLFASRINNLEELKKLSNFIFKLKDYPNEMLIFKKSDLNKTKKGLDLALGSLSKINKDDWSEETFSKILQKIITQHQLSPGDIFWPIRVALSGLDRSPSPTEILETLGQVESLKRLKQAIRKLD